ncbi:hypothetical protein ACSQ67_017499 [Phaseolus vulgaris]
MAYINAAFRSSRDHEVYFFTKDNIGFESLEATFFAELGIDRTFDIEGNNAYVFSTKYCAYIDYTPGTIFESGIDACFASHEKSEAYLFKGDKYVRIKFTPDATDDVLLGNVRPILDGWPCLRGILPVG